MGIGAGWYEHEYNGYGYPFPKASVRIGELGEAVEIMKRMWTEAEVNFEGKYYKLDGAICQPKPLQEPHIPFWVAGGGEKLTLNVGEVPGGRGVGCAIDAEGRAVQRMRTFTHLMPGEVQGCTGCHANRNMVTTESKELTLAFNRGAAFGLSIGDDPRWVFIPISIFAVILLGTLLRQARSTDVLRVVSVSLVMAGALGNLYDRVRWDRGVVDFIGPIDLGFMDWPIFNVADMAVSIGAVLLLISFYFEEKDGDEPEPATG